MARDGRDAGREGWAAGWGGLRLGRRRCWGALWSRKPTGQTVIRSPGPWSLENKLTFRQLSRLSDLTAVTVNGGHTIITWALRKTLVLLHPQPPLHPVMAWGPDESGQA